MISLGGLKVFVTAALPTYKPARKLASRRWHAQRIYAKRVQKKWLKRFGHVKDVEAVRAGDGIFMSREAYQRTVNALQVQR